MSPSRRTRPPPHLSGWWSTSCARPRPSRRRWPPDTGGCSAAPRSRRRGGCGARSRARSSAVSGTLCGSTGFDVGASPREFLEPRADTLILSTTNGTRTILRAAERAGSSCSARCSTSARSPKRFAGAGRTWSSSAPGSRERSRSTTPTVPGGSWRCSGGEHSDAAIAAGLVAGAFADAHTALLARTYGPPGLEEDILFCSRESVLPVVPRLAGVEDGAAEIVA